MDTHTPRQEEPFRFSLRANPYAIFFCSYIIRFRVDKSTTKSQSLKIYRRLQYVRITEQTIIKKTTFAKKKGLRFV